MSQVIEYFVENDVGVLRVNRPQARNALNWEAQEAFAAAVAAAARTPTLRALIVTGTGTQAFVSGGDLKELSQHPEPEAGQRLNRTMSVALAQMAALPVPVIAAVNGDAIGGGCEILTACDLRLAAAHARFSFAQVRNGLTSGWGGTSRLVALLGESRAMELLLTTRLFDAAEAQRLGLVHRLTADGVDVLAEALAWAEELKALPGDALAATKALVKAAARLAPADVDQLETELFVTLWPSPNHLEALAAFVEKRRPVFNQTTTDGEMNG